MTFFDDFTQANGDPTGWSNPYYPSLPNLAVVGNELSSTNPLSSARFGLVYLSVDMSGDWEIIFDFNNSGATGTAGITVSVVDGSGNGWQLGMFDATGSGQQNHIYLYTGGSRGSYITNTGGHPESGTCQLKYDSTADELVVSYWNGSGWTAAFGQSVDCSTHTTQRLDASGNGTFLQMSSDGVAATIDNFYIGAGNSTGDPRATATAPAAISDLAATPGDTQVALTWTAPSNGGSAITDYEYRVDGGTWTTIASTTPGYTVTGLTNSVSYDFEVRAVNAIGNAAASNLVSSTPSAAATAPAAVSDLAATPGNAEVALAWSAPSNGGSAITDYEYRVDAGTWTSIASTTPGFTVTGLTNGVSYDFEVRAINAIGSAAASNLVASTPVAPGVVTARIGTAFQSQSGGVVACNPATDPNASDAVLVAWMSQSNSSGFPGAGSLGSNTFGGTWTHHLNGVSWGSRRTTDCWASSDFTTPTGSVNLTENASNNQATLGGLVILENCSAYSVETNGQSDGASGVTPSLTTNDGGYLVLIAHESNETIAAPNADWTLVGRAGESSGVRSVHAFFCDHDPTLDHTPTFAFPSGGGNGCAFIALRLTASAGAGPTGPVMYLGDLPVSAVYLGDLPVNAAYLGDLAL